MSTPQHSRLVNAAAKAALGPLGCVQKGRSRTWLDDHDGWVGVVEFQPRTSIWDHYHLAVSAGLAGATDQSRQSFAAVMSDPEDRPWAADIRRRSARFMRCLELGSGFEAEVMDTVRRTRALLKLPVRAETPASSVTR